MIPHAQLDMRKLHIVLYANMHICYGIRHDFPRVTQIYFIGKERVDRDR